MPTPTDNYLVPVSEFAPVYQIELQDVWVGGPGGKANKQGQSLANRTQYLYEFMQLLATINSPSFTGLPSAPTAAPGTNTTQLATTAFVSAAIAALVNSSPGALDTLNELATALGNDANFATTMTNALALKAPLANPAFTGTPSAPTPANADNSTRLATTAFVQSLIASVQSPFRSITALPATDVGPVIVSEVCEVWNWVNTAYFVGYRSPLCGRPIFGHTASPLASEVDAVGGTLSKTAYAALWGYAQENNLVVASGAWIAGTHNFVDLGGDNFRVPDLRNQFLRMTGTDADTANAVALGAYKADTFKGHGHGIQVNASASSGPRLASGTGTGGSGALQTDSNGTAETAPRHTAYKPRIHI